MADAGTPLPIQRILDEIRTVLAENGCKEPIDGHTEIRRYFFGPPSFDDDLYDDDVFDDIACHFGFRAEEFQDFVRQIDWQSGDGAAPRAGGGMPFTFGSLACFIQSRIPRVSFQPATVLGRTCPRAGVFFGLRSLVHRIRSDVRFGPGSELTEVLRGDELALFWNQVRCLWSWRLPKTDVTAARNLVQLATGLALFLLVPVSVLCGLGAIGLALEGMYHVFVLAIALWLLLVLTFAIRNEARRHGIVPPRGIRTFRELIDALEAGFCRQCKYNLTGNVSGVCPECGRAVG